MEILTQLFMLLKAVNHNCPSAKVQTADEIYNAEEKLSYFKLTI